MAKKVEIELNEPAIRQQLLKSPEILEICKEHAEAIADRCGEGYETTTYTQPTRIVAKVYADSSSARADNMKHNTILKAAKG